MPRQGIEAPKQAIEFPAAPSCVPSKKWIKLIPKTIGNRKKRLCVRLRSGDKHHLRKSSDRKAQIRKEFVPLTGLICAFRSEDFLRWCLSPERNLTHNLFFLFPIVFGINFLSSWSQSSAETLKSRRKKKKKKLISIEAPFVHTSTRTWSMTWYKKGFFSQWKSKELSGIKKETARKKLFPTHAHETRRGKRGRSCWKSR